MNSSEWFFLYYLGNLQRLSKIARGHLPAEDKTVFNYSLELICVLVQVCFCSGAIGKMLTSWNDRLPDYTLLANKLGNFTENIGKLASIIFLNWFLLIIKHSQICKTSSFLHSLKIVLRTEIRDLATIEKTV